MKSDSDLRDDIQVELVQQFSAGAERMEVQVLDGVVTLTGNVGSDVDRWRLDDAVRKMTGVRELIDKTIAAPEAPLESSDPDIARPWFPAG